MSDSVVAPWKTNSWFTSPWNHDQEVAAQLQFPAHIQISDVTLRDGEQQTGVEFTVSDKMRIAEALAAAGVQRIEAGLPAVSPSDQEAVRQIAAMGLPASVYAFSRCMVDDVKRAIDCGVAGVTMEIPSSRHLVELGYRWTLERAVALSVEATRFAHENGLLVSFFPIDATRATMTDYLDLVEKVATDGHVDALGLVDTFGVLTPHAVDRFVRATRERVNVPLETHFHMDFGMGVANTVIALAAGASVAQVTVSGIGERAGNTPLEETVMTLLALYGIDTGIDTERFTSLARLVGELSGVEQPSNRPVTGRRLFEIESGIIATWCRNAREADALTEVLPYLPELVGQTGPSLVLGKGSGIDNVNDWLDQRGLTLDEDTKMAILRKVKQVSLDKKGLLTAGEFDDVVSSVASGVGHRS
ncbi:MAG TPA: hypothetical protein VIK06_00405 [Candidatus Limnocylindrales bacterium]|jgi:isopropylmalate/homocitrate/citramalate synthase